MRVISLFLILNLALSVNASAQLGGQVLSPESVGLEFDDAVALASDPAGMLYVVDQGRHVVQVIDAKHHVVHVLGGAGSREGQFDSPADIDPTNGLILVVADAGNQRLQRFSRDFLFLEAMPVGNESSIEGRVQASYRWGGEEVRDALGGEPIRVQTSPSNDTYAIDAVRRLVVQWDAERQPVRLIGGFEAGDGRLEDPVALAMDGHATLFVADRGRNAIVLFDSFGSYIRTMAEGMLEEVQALHVHSDRLLVILPFQILVYSTDGLLLDTFPVDVTESIRDAVIMEDKLYLLTSNRLWMASFVTN